MGHASNEQLMRLGAGDLISVRVYGQPDMDGDLYVSDEGTITVPLLGAVPVANLSSVDAARKVEAALRRQEILVQPHVTIQVVQSHSQLVSILGEIRSPGRYPISPGTNVIEMLAQAGGETQDGASFVYVLRPAPGGTKRYRISLTGLGDPHDPLTTDALEAGDSIYVPKAEEIYVYGEVRAPGEYRYEPGMTVMEAIARAGGVTDRGSSRRMALKRTGPDGQTIVVAARPDDPVQPDDNIRVKESIF
jgi:polysaccharide export outer membrane protein